MKIFYFFYSIAVLFMKKHRIKVQKIIQVDAYTQTIWFEIPEKFKWLEGSSGLFAFKQAFKRFIIDIRYMRYMTVARNEEKTFLEITCRVPGSESLFKKEVMNLKPGDEMILYNVKQHCPLIREDKHLVFLSMGIGMVTYKNLFESYESDKAHIPSITSINVDHHQTKLYINAFPNVQKYYCVNRKEYNDIVEQYLGQPNTSFYLVGSETFLHDMIKKLKNAGISNHDIIIDRSNYLRRRYYNLK